MTEYNLEKRSFENQLVKYISQINGGLVMFFGNSRIRFFKISWFIVDKNQDKKKERNQHSQC